MTFKEWMVENNPGFISRYTRGTYGCPYEYGLEISEESNKNCTVNGGKGCEYCWNREMPMILKELIEKKKMYFKSKFNVGDKVMVNPNWEREFPYRDNFGIESWKKYLGKEFTVKEFTVKEASGVRLEFYTLEEIGFNWPSYMLKGKR